MDCFPCSSVKKADSEWSLLDGPVAVSFSEFDLRAEEKVNLYKNTSRDRPVVFTDDSNVDMWKSSPSVLIKTASPIPLLLADVGSNQECVEMIGKKFFPSGIEPYIRWAVPSVETTYVSIIVSDNGMGTRHQAHIVISPSPVEGNESDIIAEDTSSNNQRRVSGWVHYSLEGKSPRPKSRDSTPRRNYREQLETKPWLLEKPSTPYSAATDQPSTSSTLTEPESLGRRARKLLSSASVDKVSELGCELVDTVVETAVKTVRSRSRSPLERDDKPTEK